MIPLVEPTLSGRAPDLFREKFKKVITLLDANGGRIGAPTARIEIRVVSDENYKLPHLVYYDSGILWLRFQTKNGCPTQFEITDKTLSLITVSDILCQIEGCITPTLRRKIRQLCEKNLTNTQFKEQIVLLQGLEKL